MSRPFYDHSPEMYRHEMGDRDRGRAWDERDRSRGRPGGGGGMDPYESYGRLREDDFAPNGARKRTSPGPMMRRRLRSRSPPHIDRYTPGGPPIRYAGDVYIPGGPPPFKGGPPQRGDSADFDLYPPPSNHGSRPNNSHLAPILLDPHSFDYTVPFNYFSDWFLGTPASTPSKSKYTIDMTMKERYEAYKDGLGGRLAKIFVKNHKDEEWFRERYLEAEQGWKEKMTEWRKGQWNIWEQELASGRWDTWLADAKEGAKKDLTSQTNGKTEKVDKHEKVEGGSSEPKDDIMDEGIIEEETPATSSGTGGLRDDSLDRPALLIKTVSPSVQRAKLEELASTVKGFQYLSLGDPNPLKKFHRIGWILVDPSSVVEGSLEAAAAQLNEERIHDEEKGDFVVHVGVHNPPKVLTRKMLHDVMSLPQTILSEVDRIREVVLKLERSVMGSEDDIIMDEDGHLQSYRGWDLIITKVDEIMTARMAEKALAEPEEEPEDGEAEEDKPSDEDLERAKRTIDIAVEYLRRVFSFCYYCFTEADSIHELVRRCPGGHIRRPLPSNTAGESAKTLHPGSERWMKNLHEKIELFLNAESFSGKKKLGYQDFDSAVQEETNKFIKQEDEGKFRCRIKDCTKLFKSEEFVRKHMIKRHVEFIEGIEQEAKLVNAYALDPFRVVLPKPDPSNMNGQGGPPGSSNSGVPAGMSLPPRPGGLMEPNRGPMMPYGMGYPMPPYGDGYPMPPGMIGPPPAGVDRYIPGGRRSISPSRGGPGPIRRRGGAVGPPGGRPTPYSRPSGGRDPRDRERDRETRFQAAMALGGVLPANPAAAVASVVGKEQDLAGAAGRSLKSYMDLDATKTDSKADELDY